MTKLIIAHIPSVYSKEKTQNRTLLPFILIIYSIILYISIIITILVLSCIKQLKKRIISRRKKKKKVGTK